MVVIMMQNAGSSAVGPFRIGEEKEVPDGTAKEWIKRGVCRKKKLKVKGVGSGDE